MSQDPREALRAQTTELLQRLRAEPHVPQALWELLEVLAQRLSRIELGTFVSDEIPTRPDRKVSSGAMPAVSERVQEIFDEAKKKT